MIVVHVKVVRLLWLITKMQSRDKLILFKNKKKMDSDWFESAGNEWTQNFNKSIYQTKIEKLIMT